MNTQMQFEFLVNKENNQIVVTREFAAPLHLVWAAYTQSDLLEQWWAPKPWKSKTKKMDFTEGGEWFYAMVGPNNEEHWALIKYHEIEFEKRFTGVDMFTDPNGTINESLPISNWEFNFTGHEDHTTVVNTITYADLAQLEAIIQMGFKEGFTMAMENLDELLPTL